MSEGVNSLKNNALSEPNETSKETFLNNVSRIAPVLPNQNICNAEIGDNPFFNLFDQAMRF